MKVSSIVAELDELERKRDEINNVLNESAYGEASVILERELESYRKQVDTFLDAEFEPISTVIYINATAPATLGVGDVVNMSVTATLSDGTTRDVTSNRRAMMLFRDFDNIANNTGYITSVDITDYRGEEGTFEVVKTHQGFDVDDRVRSQGLQVLGTENPNEYQVADKDGTPLGIVFTTDGNEVTGDDWLIDIYWSNTGTIYESLDTSVATVDEVGTITAVGGGIATITVTNGLQSTLVNIEVVDDEAPEPPTITDVIALEEGAEIHFDYSTSPDVVSYNIYVDGVQTAADVIESPFTISNLVSDGTTSYAIQMTAVDGSGNESEHSNIVTVTPDIPSN